MVREVALTRTESPAADAVVEVPLIADTAFPVEPAN
jgi:hypothetical protein